MDEMVTLWYSFSLSLALFPSPSAEYVATARKRRLECPNVVVLPCCLLPSASLEIFLSNLPETASVPIL